MLFVDVLFWFWCWWLNIIYKFRAHYSSCNLWVTCDPIVMYSLGLFVVNPRRACAARVVCVCVGLSVPLSAAILALQATRRPYERYQLLQNYANLKKKRAIFPKLLRSRDIYAVKTQKQMCIIAPAYLEWSACSLYLAEAQEVTTKAVYRIPHRHAILQCSQRVSDSPRPTSVETTN